MVLVGLEPVTSSESLVQDLNSRPLSHHHKCLYLCVSQGGGEDTNAKQEETRLDVTVTDISEHWKLYYQLLYLIFSTVPKKLH